MLQNIVRSFTRNYPVSYGVSYPTSYAGSSYTYYFTNYIFELAGNVYNVTMSSESSEDILMYKEYKIYELTTEENLQELKDLLIQMHVNYQYRYYYNIERAPKGARLIFFLFSHYLSFNFSNYIS